MHSEHPSRHPPPVNPSQSLEGMEKAVRPIPYAHTISRLHLDKPLPDLPSTQQVSFIGSTAWSDDSSNASFEDDHEHEFSNDNRSEASYPVFVCSGSDDLADVNDRGVSDSDHFVDHSVSVSASTLTAPHDHDLDHHTQKPAPSLNFLAEDRYRPSSPTPIPPPHWNAHARVGPNHYFREKKFDFFPELATPGALPRNSTPHSSTSTARNGNLRPRKKDSGRSVSRWIPNPAEKGAALANDVRNSIRSIQRRLSRNSLDRKMSRSQTRCHNRPATAPSPSEYSYASPPRTYTVPAMRSDPYCSRFHSHSPTSALYFEKEALTHLSLSPTGSSISDQSIRAEAARQCQSRAEPLSRKQSRKPTQKQRKPQPAVPMSLYQRYGAAIWDKSGKEKKRLSYRGQTPRVRFPKYRSRSRKSRRGSAAPSKSGAFVSSATSPSPLRPRASRPESESDFTFESGIGSDWGMESSSGLGPGSRARPGYTHAQAHPRKPLLVRQGTRFAVRALQDGTSQVLVAIDGARKKIARTGSGFTLDLESGSRAKLDQKRMALKSQIRLVRPADGTFYHDKDPWV
ncbi:hypothetical protein BDV18DRAFT_130549 [Aspergillus unguis]